MVLQDENVKGWSRMTGAFRGLRVLDLSWGIAGPMTTMFLADQGAEVIRIEPPPGDPFAQQTGYRVWNRGKLSVRLDLQSDEGKEQFDRLAQTSDVVVDSFSLGTTERLGIDHEALSALNPRIITCSITAYGEHNIHRDRPGYDGLVAARTGLLFDQKGRRGTAMEFIGGRPGPLPEFDAPDGLVRGADRKGQFSAHPVAKRRCDLPRHTRDCCGGASSSGIRARPACHHVSPSRCTRRGVSQLAAGGEPRRSVVLDVAD